jgi:hypothetical protein
MPNVAVINRSSVVNDTEVRTITTALQKQVTDHFKPFWGVDASLTFVGQGDLARKDAWWLTILDDSDQAEALGYHDVTVTGLPLGKAFAKSDLAAGYRVSVTVSHELLEMLADPEINLCAQVGDRLYAYEVCDPCEADPFGYLIGDTLVSDFVTPAWFRPTLASPGPYDFREVLDKPLTLLAGGYLQYLQLTDSAGWQQETASKSQQQQRPRVGSRRERRRVRRDSWSRSTAEA